MRAPIEHGSGSPKVSSSPLCCLMFLVTLLVQRSPAQESPAAPDASSTNAPPAVVQAAPATNAAPEGEPKARPKETPGTPAKSNNPAHKEALSKFRLRPGFRIEIVASEPLVSSPVALAFDENGRLFVAERNTDERIGAVPGRIRVLEDVDGEGVFTSSAILSDAVKSPSGLVCYEGGVFVAAASEIVYLKDTRGEGKADVNRVAFSGFGGTNFTGKNFLGPLVWGPDNRIHGCSAGLAGTITSPIQTAIAPLDLRGADFSFDPRTLSMRPETGPSSSGLVFHPDGTRFVTAFLHPLQQTMYEQRYLLRNPRIPAAPGLIDIVEPALRVAVWPEPGATNEQRSRMAVGAARTNDAARLSMQQARGTLLYASGLFGTNFLGNVFVADPETRVISRILLRQQGPGWLAARAEDESNIEFLQSSDPSFRPMHMVSGPEGAIYVADARDDGRSGRIYRIIPDHFKQPSRVRLSALKTPALVTNLVHSHSWQRDQASRLLFEQEDKQEAPSLLASLVLTSRSPVAKLNALNVLDGMGMITEQLVLHALRSSDERVRLHGIRLSERLTGRDGNIADTVWYQLSTMTGDASARVRRQLIFTLGSVNRPARGPLITATLAPDIANPWFRMAAMTAAGVSGADILIPLVRNARVTSHPDGRDMLYQLGIAVGLRADALDIGAIIAYATNNVPAAQTYALLGSVGEGLKRRGISLSAADPANALRPYYDGALGVMSGMGALPALRVEAIRLVGASPFDYTGAGDLLTLLLTTASNPSEVMFADLWALSQYGDLRLATDLLARWTSIPTTVRREAVTTLISHPTRLPVVLAAIQAGTIPRFDVASFHTQVLRALPDPNLSGAANRLFGPMSPNRPEVIERFRPALGMIGLASRGRELFRARCATCHQLGGEGRRYGPRLDYVKAYGKPSVLTAILEPDLQVREGFQTVLAQAGTGQILFGVLESESAENIVVRHPTVGTVVWPAGNLQYLRIQEWSMMPKGLEEGLSPQNMADLLEFIMTSPR